MATTAAAVSVAPVFVTAPQAARIIGTSPTTIKRLAHEGRIGIIRVDGVSGTRYCADDCRAVRDAGYQPATLGIAAERARRAEVDELSAMAS